MKRLLMFLFVIFALSCVVELAHGQTFKCDNCLLTGSQAVTSNDLKADLTVSNGRVYNILTGQWTLATVPGFEVSLKDWTVGGSWSLDLKGDGYFAQDWFINWERTWRDKLTVSATGSIYIFKELGTDRVWLVETRYRIFGRN